VKTGNLKIAVLIGGIKINNNPIQYDYGVTLGNVFNNKSNIILYSRVGLLMSKFLLSYIVV
jgi:hypothetical protein